MGLECLGSSNLSGRKSINRSELRVSYFHTVYEMEFVWTGQSE